MPIHAHSHTHTPMGLSIFPKDTSAFSRIVETHITQQLLGRKAVFCRVCVGGDYWFIVHNKF